MKSFSKQLYEIINGNKNKEIFEYTIERLRHYDSKLAETILNIIKITDKICDDTFKYTDLLDL